MSVRIGLVGAKGRMGRAIAACLQGDARAECVGGVDLGDDPEPLIQQSDVVIEFSHFSNSWPIAQLCVSSGKALVIGTTGHDDELRRKILEAGQKIPLIFAPNYSVGVNVLFYLTRLAARALGKDYDLEVVEMHHRLKKDAPSGTARRLAEILCEERKASYQEWVRHGRSGETGERTREEIGVHALRGGDVVGDHTVIFAASGERIELTHKASSREAFARGAVEAAVWLHGKPAGVYGMAQVLGMEA